MDLKAYMDIIDYRVTEGSEFCWSCFGNNAYRLDSWSGAWTGGAQDGYTVSVTFDTRTQGVYQIEAWDYKHDRAYRWTAPAWREAHDNEARDRGIDPDDAWDDVKFVNLEVEADFIEKARAIVEGREYDTRVQIEIELSDSELLAAMKLAHELDITFNQLVVQSIEAHIDSKT